MITIYFVSGLGADERAFQLLKIGPVNKKYIQWQAPERNESLEHYVRKLSLQVADPGNSIIVGLSFGGIIAVELSKILHFAKTVIISSIKSSDELPRHFKFLKYFKIYKLAPYKVFNRYNSIISYAFGITSGFENEILKNVIEETDPRLIKWAIDKVINWNNPPTTGNIIHVHGTDDRLFPYRFIKNAIKVEGGTHFMIVNKAEIISSIISKELNS